ncbi:AraC family transcriptional regulator [Agrobacterium larrymoorei]|uniref:AraC-like DNA-binding protein n=1 Tax=Agrobacterium larrymoorei TaxID=160699 RepID=A0ABU0UH18_9HYPH|nr:AraC family transcriptional regulator [Agrobacterium larrymoorei]MDQ1184236.1 AraC-like DNA-binding protein [Agrobacterium larrymoorei]
MIDIGKRQPETRPVVDTHDVDEAREAIGRIFCPHFLLAEGTWKSDFHAVHDVVEEPGHSINVVSYGSAVEIDPGELSRFFLLQLPVRGSAVVRCGDKETQVAEGRTATLLSPTLFTRMRWAEGCEKLIVLLERDLVESHFETLAHERCARIEFEPAIDLTGGVGQGIFQHSMLMSGAAKNLGHFPEAYRIMLRDGLVNLLLSGLRHNGSGLLQRSNQGAGPVPVQRAEDYIRTNAERSITAADIAEAAGVPLRTLQDSYRKAKGQTLMEAVQDARLELLRQSLLRPSADISVADAVFASGLGHLGRAAIAYRERYGETPSQTLRRSRGWS